MLADFSAPRLIQLIQSAAIICVVFNAIAAWKQEARSAARRPNQRANNDPTFAQAWATFCAGPNTLRRLDDRRTWERWHLPCPRFCWNPTEAKILQWSVASTTKLTALLAFGSLLGLAYGSYVLKAGVNPYRIAFGAAAVGIPAFALVILAAPLQVDAAFLAGNLAIGFGAALFAHATLTATMTQAPSEQSGLALGAWGAVQATAAGIAMALGVLLRDLVDLSGAVQAPVLGVSDAAAGYLAVYALEIGLLLITLAATLPLLRRTQASKHDRISSHDVIRDERYPV